MIGGECLGVECTPQRTKKKSKALVSKIRSGSLEAQESCGRPWLLSGFSFLFFLPTNNNSTIYLLHEFNFRTN
ncbi:hypothetical protein M5689_011593 [Euphorbia peplus]|nr:hypothetical protein M5689_011593 [Euphorbia peplus]